MDPYESEKVETEAGEYTIELHYDEYADNPLTDYDHEGMGIYVYRPGGRHGGGELLNSLSGTAGDALQAIMQKLGPTVFDSTMLDSDDVVRWYAKWKAITGSKWALFEGGGNGAMQSDWWNWFVLVNEDEYTDPALSAKATMDDYQNWAQGGYRGYVVKNPDGEMVESVWGFGSEDDALSEAREIVAYDAEQRVAAAALAAEQAMVSANLVGSGFVGLI